MPITTRPKKEKTLDDIESFVALIFGMSVGYAKSKGVSLDSLRDTLEKAYKGADNPLTRNYLFSKLITGGR